MNYSEWIKVYISKNKIIAGMCGSATTEMCKEFPELKRVPGHVMLVNGAYVEHWWCIDEASNIIDPTASQWDFLPEEYIPWKPGDEVCVGRCMECGDSIYEKPDSLKGNRKEFCSNECKVDFTNTLM